MTLDITQVSGSRRNDPDAPPPPTMVRLHNPQTGVQIQVTEQKAARLIAEGTYRTGPNPAPKQQGK